MHEDLVHPKSQRHYKKAHEHWPPSVLDHVPSVPSFSEPPKPQDPLAPMKYNHNQLLGPPSSPTLAAWTSGTSSRWEGLNPFLPHRTFLLSWIWNRFHHQGDNTTTKEVDCWKEFITHPICGILLLSNSANGTAAGIGIRLLFIRRFQTTQETFLFLYYLSSTTQKTCACLELTSTSSNSELLVHHAIGAPMTT